MLLQIRGSFDSVLANDDHLCEIAYICRALVLLHVFRKDLQAVPHMSLELVTGRSLSALARQG